MHFFIYGMLLLTGTCVNIVIAISDDVEPDFDGPILTQPIRPTVGKDVSLICRVKNLAHYKVSWNYVEQQTLLTIQSHVITQNPRIGVHHETNNNHSKWFLIIRNISLADSVPPEFDNDAIKSGAVLTIREYENVTLNCKAKGNPKPKIKWRREDGQEILLPPNSKHKDRKDATVIHSDELILGEVSRWATGGYLCVASNDIAPSISRRIMLVVHFPPMIMIPVQILTVPAGTDVNLDCIVEANPAAQQEWIYNSATINANNKYAIRMQRTNRFKIYYKLSVRDVSHSDAGQYVCMATNELGETRGVLTLHVIDAPLSTTVSYNYNHNYPIKEYELPSEENTIDEKRASPESHLDHKNNNNEKEPNFAKSLTIDSIAILSSIVIIISY